MDRRDWWLLLAHKESDTTERLVLSLSGGGRCKSPRVHCPLCCGPLSCIVCECWVILSSIVRNGFPSGSCMPAKSLQSCPALASGFFNPYLHLVVNNSPAMQELQDTRRLDPWGRENALCEEMATHSNIPAWEIPWTEEPGGLQSMNVLARKHIQK